MEDSQIVDLYFQREEAAITRTAEKYGARLRALSMRIVEDVQTAEECENDTYAQAWNAIPPHAPRDYLFAFLAKLTRQISLNRCRERSSQKRNAVVFALGQELEQCIPAPDNCACRVEELVLKEAINGFLGALKPETRNIFLRRYWFFDSISEISRRFGISESKVKVTLYRCRRELRAYLQKEGIEL